MEKERDDAKEKSKVARPAAVAAGDAKARVEGDLAEVQEALTTAEEARSRAEAKTALLEVERMSLLLKFGAAKDEVSSLHSKAGKDKDAMEEDYHKALEVIFAYGYGCCALKHNICGDQPEVAYGMPDSADPLPVGYKILVGYSRGRNWWFLCCSWKRNKRVIREGT